MSHGSRSLRLELANGGDFQLGQMTAEALGFVEAFAAFEFESDALRSAELVNHLGGDFSTLDEWGADSNTVTLATENYLAENDFGIDFCFEFLDVELVTLLDAVLFTACFDYCVGHGRDWKEFLRLWAGAESTMIHPFMQGIFYAFSKKPEKPLCILKNSWTWSCVWGEGGRFLTLPATQKFASLLAWISRHFRHLSRLLCL
jgi:hypothetical protein